MHIKLIKKCFGEFRNSLIFHSELFLTWQCRKTTSKWLLLKVAPGKSSQVLAWLGIPSYTQAKVVISDATFLCWISPYKNQKCWYILFKDIADQRILQFDWKKTFWPITCEAEFSQTSFHTINCEVFHYGLTSTKDDKILWKIEKTSFWTIHNHFLCKQEIFWKTHICHYFLFLNFYWYAIFLKKLMTRSKEKLVTYMWGWMDGQRMDMHEVIGFSFLPSLTWKTKRNHIW